MLTPKNLHPEQLSCYKDILKKKVFCITSDCGFGKTISILTAFVVMKKKYPDRKLLVVCTPMGAKKTWVKEPTNWTHTKHLKVLSLNNLKPNQREVELNKNQHDIYVISYQMLGWLLENNKTVKFDFVAGDEADCLKGPSSVWRDQLIKCAPSVVYKILASATPKTREEDDYWGLCKYLDDGKSLNAETVTEFRARYCKSYTHKNRTIYKIGNKKQIADLENRIRHLFINYDTTTQSQIPIKTITVNAELSDSSREIYDRLVREQCVNSIVYDDDGYRDDDESLDAMTLSGKLSQLSCGFLYIDENIRITADMLEQATSIPKLLDDTTKKIPVDIFDDRIVKFGKLINVLHERHEDTPIAIPYHYKHELTQLEGLLPTGVRDTEPDFEERWNDKDIPYLFLQYMRSSKSLNIQDGGNVMAFYSPTWSWADDYQIIRRLARQGQSAKMVYAYRLYMKGTIDDNKTRKLTDRFIGHSRFQNSIIHRV